MGQELFCKWIPPVFPHGTFIYDGDGKRVKSIMDTTAGTETTYFVGAHYQVVDDGTTQKIIKYYFAGSQRIAMRTNGTLNFLLGDHLGSTSLVTDANGQNPIETRYTAWGEVRYSSGTMPTKYSFTGQFSYANDFGLLFFNARWVDPLLGRFAQADSIIPGAGNSVAWDRYAYSLNSPVNYTDPSGHAVCGGNWYAQQYAPFCDDFDVEMGISFVGGWDKVPSSYKTTVRTAVWDVANGLASVKESSNTSQQAFKDVFQTDSRTLAFQWGTGGPYSVGPACEGIGFGGCTTGHTQGVSLITFADWYDNPPYANADLRNRNMVVHELGHLFGASYKSNGQTAYDLMSSAITNDPTLKRPNKGEYGGFASPFGTYTWQVPGSNVTSPNEVFADMFLGWTYGEWYSGSDQQQISYATNRSAWMTTNMDFLLNK